MEFNNFQQPQVQINFNPP